MIRIFALMLLLFAFQAQAQLKRRVEPAKSRPRPKPAAPKVIYREVPQAAPEINLRDVLVLKVSCNADCWLYLDGESRGRLAEGDVHKLNLRKGSFRLQAVSTENNADRQQVEFTVNHTNQEQFYDIDLRSVINKRLRAEENARQRKALLEKIVPDMVLVEGGSFRMGCTSEQQTNFPDAEKPVHGVTLSSFYIGRYEVTQALWASVMGSNPSRFSDCNQCPVERVSWDDVQEFLRKLNGKTGNSFRLPTEAEWEYAARGGQQSKGYQYSGSNDLDAVGWYSSNSGYETHPVGGKQANELGLYDMTGNVWEWCSDWYDERYYASSPFSNPGGPGSGEYRVSRGGSRVHEPVNCRTAKRGFGTLGDRSDTQGFRLALPSR